MNEPKTSFDCCVWILTTERQRDREDIRAGSSDLESLAARASEGYGAMTAPICPHVMAPTDIEALVVQKALITLKA